LNEDSKKCNNLSAERYYDEFHSLLNEDTKEHINLNFERYNHDLNPENEKDVKVSKKFDIYDDALTLLNKNDIASFPFIGGMKQNSQLKENEKQLKNDSLPSIVFIDDSDYDDTLSLLNSESISMHYK